MDAGFLEHNPTEEKSLDETGIIGFGSPVNGAKLIVQIMTEDKRRELDLETLWENSLDRQRKLMAIIEEDTDPDKSDQAPI